MLNCLCGRELENLAATIGVGFMNQEFDIEIDAEKWQSTLYLWDTSGTEKYRSIITPYLRHVAITLIVFDVGDSTTWKHVDYWRDLALDQAGQVFEKLESPAKTATLPLICLVGCQADKDDQAVSEKEIEKKATDWSCPWWKVSTRSSLELEGTPPHLFAETGEDGITRLVENPQAKSVWSHFLKAPRSLSPKEQMFTVFGHMAVEFHRFARLIDQRKLNYETCSLGPAPPASGGVVRIVNNQHKRRKSDCCLDQ
jgi:GTPase SAR1 family protein